MNYVGDFDVGAVIMIWFNTFDSNDPSVSVTMTNFINTDVHIHKDDSLTQRNNAAGITVDVDVDAIAGSHFIKVDSADNTVADFFEAGHDYAVRVEGVTVDAGTLNAVVGTFSIANRRVAGQMCVSSIATLASQTSFTLTAGEASANNDAYNGCTIIVTDQVTKIQKAIGHISDYVGTSRTITLHAAPLQTAFTMAVGDSVEIIATSVFTNVNTVGQTLQTANDNGADINAILLDSGELQADDIPTLIAALPTAVEIQTEMEENGASILDTVRDELANATDGLSALKTLLDSIIAAVITNATGVDVAADIIAVKAETTLIVGDTGTDGVVLKVAGLNADAVDKILDEVVEGTITVRQAFRILIAAVAGKTTGGGTVTASFRNIADDGNRIVATVDVNGNRTAMTLDGS
ncbi:hypothetical protein LCGC14_1560990 [marine sediment metagenome]|uniref:Uncharacterized protein n=1 Tax=marine sediment metagenome TaxID=412755 RepID=A0A0F9J8H6_9ZZZZ